MGSKATGRNIMYPFFLLNFLNKNADECNRRQLRVATKYVKTLFVATRKIKNFVAKY